MGNLYTHIERKDDPRLKILSELKQYWRNHPRDYKIINRLRSELHRLEKAKQQPKMTELQKLGTIAYYKKLRNKPHGQC
jgi:hypothetical protein